MTVKLTGESRLFPIVGDPVIYLRSPEVLTRNFAARGHNAVNVPMLVRDGDLAAVLGGLSLVPNVDGVLITMPHKLTAHRFCATLSNTSRLLEAVSVIRRNPDGTWHGDMTDGRAFVAAQIANGARPAGARALLLGAGGAGSAIAVALLEAGVGALAIHDPDAHRVARLIERLGSLGAGRVTAGPPDPTDCDMVCNATPLGMAAGDPLPLDAALLPSTAFVGDVIAGHGATPFLRAARARGCATANGDQMVDAVQEMMLDFLLGAARLG